MTQKSPAKKRATKKKVTKKKILSKKASPQKMDAKTRAREKKIEDYLKKMDIEVEDCPVQVSDPQHALSTGLLMLDLIFCGGYHRGRMYTHSGPPGSSKTTIVQSAIRAAQEAGVKIYHLDFEGAAEAKYMKRMGITLDSSYRAKTDHAVTSTCLLRPGMPGIRWLAT
jgi:RecA/RadA recombinase